MAAKAIFLLCAQALLIQYGFCQCLGRTAAPCGLAGAGWAYDGLAVTDYGCAGNAMPLRAGYTASFATGPAFDFTGPYGIGPASGGALPISNGSPFAPAGLIVRSDNAIEGLVAVSGSLPFVSAVALEGILPTVGSGTVTYSCGNGAIGIAGDSGFGAAAVDGFAYENGLAYGNNLAYDGVVGPSFRSGCGNGVIY